MFTEFDISNYIIDLNQFQIIKKNKWHGASGCISIVKDKNTNTQYVAKVLKDSIKNDANTQKRFFNYLKIGHLLRGYPNIVNFFGFNLSNYQESEGSINPTLFFEFISNGTLDHYFNTNNLCFKKKKLSNTKKQICMIGIAIGVYIIHQKGIVHLDLKPDNILLDENLYPKIIDFGSAKILNQQAQIRHNEEEDNDEKENYFSSSDFSAPLYTSPEILKLISFDEKADVYSYAYVLYKIISEAEPRIESESILELYNQILKGKRPDLSVIQKTQKKLSETTLHTDKLERLLLSDSQDDIIDYDFTKLISECWDQDPKKRPSFFDIINRLLSDKSLLLPDVDLEEVDNYLKKFDDIEIVSKTGQNSNDKNKHFHFRSNYNRENDFPISQGKSQNSKNLNKFDIPDYKNLDELCKRQIDLAIDTRDIESCATVGYNLANGFNGFPQCINEAAKYLKIAIEGHNPSAMNTFATLLMKKSSTTLSKSLKEQRENTAKQLYKIAADLGNTFAMIAYSKILYQEFQSSEQTKKGSKKLSNKKKNGKRYDRKDILKRTLSSSAADETSSSFTSAISLRSHSTPIKPSNSNDIKDDDDNDNDDSKSSKENNNYSENDEISISNISRTSQYDKDEYNDTFTDHDIDASFDDQYYNNDNEQEFEEEEEEATNYSDNENDDDNDNDADEHCDDSNDYIWSESMRYMKLAADNENLIAINMYSEMFGNEEDQQSLAKSMPKSTYRVSSNKSDKE